MKKGDMVIAKFLDSNHIPSALVGTVINVPRIPGYNLKYWVRFGSGREYEFPFDEKELKLIPKSIVTSKLFKLIENV